MVFNCRGERAAGLASRRTIMVGAAKKDALGQRSMRSNSSAGSKPPLSGITFTAPAAKCGSP
jgi:hypothetical protein